MISLIIPCWNDAPLLPPLLAAVRSSPHLHEILIADASDDDHAVATIARTHDATVVRSDRPNRGRQMNLAAARATGDVLLFHHADTQLTPIHLASLAGAMQNPAILAGAFHRTFDPAHTLRARLLPLVRFYNARRGTLWGDQSLFTRRSHFHAIGGFKEIPLMEDVDISTRLRRAGGIALLDPPVYSSSRRHQNVGNWRTSLENLALLYAFKLGADPEKLHAHYYRRKQHRAPRDSTLPLPDAD